MATVQAAPSRLSPFWSMRHLAFISIAISTMAFLGISGYRFRGTIQNALASATTRKPEAYTELYFYDYQALSHYLKANQATDYSFVIANHEAKATTYHYQSWLVSQNGNKLLASGSARLEVGQTMRRTVSVTPYGPLENYRLVVVLTDRQQEVNLRLNS